VVARFRAAPKASEISVRTVHKIAIVSLVAGLALGTAALPASGQAPQDGTITWVLVHDEGESVLAEFDGTPADSLHAVASRVARDLHRRGYYFAVIDSASVGPETTRLYATRGPLVVLGEIQVSGAAKLSPETIRAGIQAQPGEPVDLDALEEELERVAARYAALGFAGARLTIGDLRMEDNERPVLHLRIEVDEGAETRLAGVQIETGRASNAALVRRMAGLRENGPIGGVDLEGLRQRLIDTGVYRFVGLPSFHLTPSGDAMLHIELHEADAGNADFVLGYLPGRDGSGGELVGSGHLLLNNPFGDGRLLDLRLERLPALSSIIDVRVSDPMLFGLPLRAGIRFHGVQRDSTFGRRDMAAELAYRIDTGLFLVGTGSRELVRPGLGGRAAADPVPRSDAWFAGLGLEFRRVDDRSNPSRGGYLLTLLERGVKDRQYGSGEDRPTSGPVRQERFTAAGRLFVPLFARHVFVAGADGRMLLSNAYDPSDMIHLGGARTLRGYDEDRFRGRAAGRGLVEYRIRTDPESYIFAFADLGLVESIVEGSEFTRGLYPGYGVGAQLRTDVGLLLLSYGMNPEDGLSAGRLHFGLSFGL
jgi:outer membrane protein assembly factor BamA